MRSYNPVFATYNAAKITQRVVIVEIYFDDISDVVYVTSHQNVNLPTGAVSIQGVITQAPVTSQELQPSENHSTNGDAQYTILDKNGEFTQLLRQKNADGKSVYKKTIVMRAGFVGMDFQYTEIIATHQIERMKHSGLSYTLLCYDIQRFAQREDVFDPVKTLLTGNVSPTATVFPAQNTSKFEMVYHGPSHSTEPSMVVGYFKLNKNNQTEIVAYTGKTNAEFNGCIRGRFGTVPIQWDGLDSEGESNELEITEVVYFELPVVKALYAILTNTLYADTGAHWPTHWSANVDERWVNTTSFVNIGSDIWDISNDDSGKICRFFMPEKENAKTFMYKELLPMIGCRFIIDKFGQIELRKITEILSTAPHVAELNHINIIKASEVEYAHSSILNFIRIDWSYDPIRESFLRTSAFADKPSILKYKTTNKKTIELHGMHGSRHNRDFIRHLFYVMRDQFGEEPLSTSVKVHPSYNALEVGDIVRLNMSNRADYTSDSILDRSFEIHSTTIDWLRNPFPQLKLVGSSRKTQIDMNDDPDSDDMYNIGYAIDSSIYSLGVDIEVAFPGSVSRVGSQVSLTSDIEITGNSQLTIDGTINPACVFRVNGDFKINAGVKITGNRNVILVVDGFLLVDGGVETTGRGGRGGDYRRTYVNQIGTVTGISDWLDLWGGSTKIYLSNYNNTYQHAEPGFIHGSLSSQNAILIHPTYTTYLSSVGSHHVDGLYEYETDYSSFPWTTTETYVSGDPVRRNVLNAPIYGGSLPTFEIDKFINGLPSTLEGGGGPAGGHIYTQATISVDLVTITPVAHGSNGGNGGGGLVTITKGMDFGINGYINTSGSASATDCGTYTSRGETFVAGRGAGGSPGCWLCIIDGADSTPPIINSSKFIAGYGESASIGNPTINNDFVVDGQSFNIASTPIRYYQSDLAPILAPSNGQRGIDGSNHASATVTGTQSLQGINFWDSFHKVIFVANQDLVISDPEEIDEYAPDALSVVLNEVLNSPPTPAGNRSSIEVYAQPPSPLLNYSHSIIEWKYAADTVWNRLNIVAQDEMVFDLQSNGATVNVRALAVSTSGMVSPSGPSSSITLTNIVAGQFELDFGFDPDTGAILKIIDTYDSDAIVVDLSGGGLSGIVSSGSGSSGSIILATDGKIATVGKTDIDDGIEGVLLGDVAGEATLYVGDGANQAIYYQAGVLTIGSDVNIVGLRPTGDLDYTGQIKVETTESTDFSIVSLKPHIELKYSGITLPYTDLWSAQNFGRLESYSSSDGGLVITGASKGTAPGLMLWACGAPNTSDTSIRAAMWINATKSNGAAAITQLDDDENLLSITSGVNRMLLKGNGRLLIAHSFMTGVANSGGGVNNVDPGGVSVNTGTGTGSAITVNNNGSVAADISSQGDVSILGSVAEHIEFHEYASGSSQVLSAPGSHVLVHTSALATLGLQLPTGIRNGDICRIASRAAVTALTLTADSGQTVTGAATTIAADTGIAYVFRLSNLNWYRLY